MPLCSSEKLLGKCQKTEDCERTMAPEFMKEVASTNPISLHESLFLYAAYHFGSATLCTGHLQALASRMQLVVKPDSDLKKRMKEVYDHRELRELDELVFDETHKNVNFECRMILAAKIMGINTRKRYLEIYQIK